MSENRTSLLEIVRESRDATSDDDTSGRLGGECSSLMTL